MTEVEVPQRSEEWLELRSCVPLTASRFGDALGVGKGRPYDFLQALLCLDPDQLDEQVSNRLNLETNLEEQNLPQKKKIMVVCFAGVLSDTELQTKKKKKKKN